ncbi:hypothetical protein GGQ97_000313 [Sphingomonas kaistensis]|uniref:Uncharacterized protein n=1 Tax=Sphingomonas kaistensis TaxID=298708 RepID=A0A7X6BFJ5_9SPHN|nr:hypothetical protein [Sphingomonas kaistensis]NJC04520.1 hypothetical protein [Sphingomonas kaistensis]
MDEDETPPVSEADRLLYDWFKHLTSLSLLAIGGALSLSQAGGAKVDPIPLGIIVIAMGVAGACSFSGADQLVRAAAEGKPVPRSARLLQRAAPGFLGMGVGAFMAVFIGGLAGA